MSPGERQRSDRKPQLSSRACSPRQRRKHLNLRRRSATGSLVNTVKIPALLRAFWVTGTLLIWEKLFIGCQVIDVRRTDQQSLVDLRSRRCFRPFIPSPDNLLQCRGDPRGLHADVCMCGCVALCYWQRLFEGKK